MNKWEAISEVLKPKLWEHALLDKNKELAKNLTSFISDKSLSWKEVCKKMEYPWVNAFECVYDKNGTPVSPRQDVMRSHFRRTIIELKLLSIFGKHTWQLYNKAQ